MARTAPVDKAERTSCGRNVARSLSLFLVALLLGVGCGGSEQAETTGDPGEIAFELEDVGISGGAGIRATLVYETPEKTTIIVDGLDEGEPGGGGANPVLLGSGTCDEPKDTLFDLEKLRGSTSQTTVELALTALLNGDYHIQVGLPNQPQETIACGDVPQEVPQS
jgi:hypothetical protein